MPSQKIELHWVLSANAIERRFNIKHQTVTEDPEMTSTMVKVQCGECGKLTKAEQTEVDEGDPVYCTDCLVYTNCGQCGDQLVLNRSKFESVARDPVCLDCAGDLHTSSNHRPIIQPGNDKGIITKYLALTTGGLAVVFTVMGFINPVMFFVGLLTGIFAISLGVWYVWKAEVIHEIWIAGGIAALSGISMVVSVLIYSDIGIAQVLILVASGSVFLKHAIN